MIGSLRGAVVDVEGSTVLVDVGGVGYRVVVTPGTAATLPLGVETSLAISTQVREDAITLFGFADHAGRRAFEVLLGAHGVGPNLAMAILAASSVDALALAIANEDVDALCTVPGVGKKTAQRLVLELKDKFDASTGPSAPTAVTPGEAEVLAALEALGFTKAEAIDAAEGVDPAAPIDVQLKAALKSMAGRR